MKRCFSCFHEYEDFVSVCPYCGQTEIKLPAEPVNLTPGFVLVNRYIIGESVGAGGFGIVYKAWDKKLETVVAIKEFFVSRLVTRAAGEKEVIVAKKSESEYEYRRERFLAEARNMAKFGSHKNITNVFNFFEENNTAYIVMELLKGMPLDEYLRQEHVRQNGGKVDEEFALFVANEIGNALKSLHKENIVHEDVSPNNIFICSEKEIKIKLMDFGAAKLADVENKVVDIVVKPGYSPVEQYNNGKNIGPPSDIYALGATLYHMLTGVKPEESTDRKIEDKIVPPSRLNPLLSEATSNVIMKAIALDRHMRFKNVDRFLAALNGERKVIPLEKEKKIRKRKRATGVTAACLLVVAAIVSCLMLYGDKKEEQGLRPANISVWFSVAKGSDEEKAVLSAKEDFERSFPKVKLELKAIPEDEYENKIKIAAETNALPTLFESTGASETVLSKCKNLDSILETEQFKKCYFLNQYYKYYGGSKQIPLAIEIPVACVITNGPAKKEYQSDYFAELSDFGADTNISCYEKDKELIFANFNVDDASCASELLNDSENASPVMLASTTTLNEFRRTAVDYEKKYVYYDADEIRCKFTYEWSVGGGTAEEIAAAEKFLTWSLGNKYQTTLMITECSDGQIPVNPISFKAKIQSKNLSPIEKIYGKFVFEREKVK